MTHKVAIIIPARYGSTRFPGKPLAEIRGKAMLQWVFENARAVSAVSGITSSDIFIGVATDDERIEQFCNDNGIPVCMTAPELPTGSDRVHVALKAFKISPEIVLNLQGDTPLTKAPLLAALIEMMLANPQADVGTPLIQMTWDGLDAFRQVKETTPFSGTTCVREAKTGKALWFSKRVIPGIRKEEKLRAENELSPVFRHIGLYGFRVSALERFTKLDKGHYEELEGLEQLRMLENGMSIYTVLVPSDSMPAIPGVDSPEDLARVEAFLSEG